MLMLDIQGSFLTAEDCHLLRQPQTAGVILFSRNIIDAHQVLELCKSIHQINVNLIIGVDQEGGRVARLRKGFSSIPAMSAIKTLQDYRQYGYLLAYELQMVGIDFTFAPVLDLNHGTSKIIGDRALAQTPNEVINNANALLDGFAISGIKGCGKHFPGHGFAQADTHLAIAKDNRSLSEIINADLLPFKALKNRLAAIMPAHVIYPQIDVLPAGFSTIWLQDILRRQIGFNGLIISDDLQMFAATKIGDIKKRTIAAINAGCDIVLVCNDRANAEIALITLQQNNSKIISDLSTKFKC